MIAGFRRVLRGESNIDFIGRTKLWALITLGVFAVSLTGLFGRTLNLGLEFKGGTSLSVPLRTEATVEEIEGALAPFELGDLKVQIQGEGIDGRALVRAKRVPPDQLSDVRSALASVAGQAVVDEVDVQDVGPTWGRQVSNKALRGLIVFLILVTIYISVRFEPKMALSALAALFHDLIATAGIYALVGFEVTPATVIALLTLMGFSLYDTVVVFDRVRENGETLTQTGKMTYSAMMNRSINEVLVRSINTSISSVLPVGGLLFVGVLLFGAVTLKDLALAMFVGTMVSTYSSIFVASPILAWLKEREPRYRQLRARLGGEAVPARAGAAAAQTPAPSPGARIPAYVARGAPRPRRRKRGSKRR